MKETYTRTDVSQINFDGKEKDKIQIRLKNNIFLFKFSSNERAAEWMKAFKSVWSLKSNNKNSDANK